MATVSFLSQTSSVLRKQEGCSPTGGATIIGCWCTAIKLSEPVRGELRARYQHCLCRACLERFAEGAEQGKEK